jgi:tetratricopeptide (TPR) repeat protein
MQELIINPDNAQYWALAGHNKLQTSEGRIAARYFARALSATKNTPIKDIFLKLAISLEMAGDFQNAAQNYIKHIDFKRIYDENNKQSLYRAFGCYHKIRDFQSIEKYSNIIDPNYWNDFPGIHEIIGYSYFLSGNFSASLHWMFTAPPHKDNDEEYEKLLKSILKNTPPSFKISEIFSLTKKLGKHIFNSDNRSKILLNWISPRINIESIRSILSSNSLILESEGKCLPYLLVLESQYGNKEQIRLRSQQCLILHPESPSAYAHILPKEEDLPTDSYSEFWIERWAKASITLSSTNPTAMNDAIIALKSVNDSESKNDYLIRAANQFPTLPIIQYNVGSHLNEHALAEIAELFLRRALIFKPAYAKSWSAYSVSYCIMLQSQEAITASLRSIYSDPELASGYTNLAMSYRGAGDISKAIDASRMALKKNPSNAVTRMGLAFNQLSSGAIEQGFKNYLSRWQQKGFPSPKRPFPQREWTNNKLAKHEKLLVYMEQGMGDELMFSWFLTYLDEQFPHQILLECDARLVELFRRSFPRIEVCPRTAPLQERLFQPDVSWKVPVAHLPHYFTSKLRELIKDRWELALKPYVSGYGWLSPDMTRVRFWRDYLQNLGNGEQRLIIGVAWRSANLARARVLQYVSPAELVRSLPDGALAVNLQYVYDDSEIEEIQACGKERNITFHTIPDLDLRDDLDEITNLCGALDALATPLTSTAFMGGVIGLPTFVFRSAPSGEIWQQLGTPHLPWLPSIRVFCRDPREDWANVLDKVRDRLSLLAEERTIGGR